MRTPDVSINSQSQLSFISESSGSVRVSDAVEMCKAQLLKQGVESSSQMAENTSL